MILTNSEIETLKSLLDDCDKDILGSNLFERECCASFLASHPHLLLPAGFDQAQIMTESNTTIAAISKRFNIDPYYVFRGSTTYQVILRHIPSRRYFLLINRPEGRGWPNEHDYNQLLFRFRPEDDSGDLTIDAYELVNQLKVFRTLNEENLRNLFLPRYKSLLWQGTGEITIVNATNKLLSQLQTGSKSLRQLTWQEFEDILAEIMIAYGFEVEQTKRTRDGGRDLIVSGELLPGINMTMAVEATTQPVVGIKKIAQALYQNRHYPLIMVATSGRFSAGVLHEQNAPENMLRLCLCNGVTIENWLDDICGIRG